MFIVEAVYLHINNDTKYEGTGIVTGSMFIFRIHLLNNLIHQYYRRFHITFAKLFPSWLRSPEGCRCNSEFRNEIRFEFPKFELNLAFDGICKYIEYCKQRQPSIFAKEIQDLLVENNICLQQNLPHSSISRCLRSDLGYSYKKLKVVARESHTRSARIIG